VLGDATAPAAASPAGAGFSQIGADYVEHTLKASRAVGCSPARSATTPADRPRPLMYDQAGATT